MTAHLGLSLVALQGINMKSANKMRYKHVKLFSSIKTLRKKDIKHKWATGRLEKEYGHCTKESSPAGESDKFTMQGRGVISSTPYPLRSKHPIQFNYMPTPGCEPEGYCDWQPLDSRLDLNIDEIETWQKGLSSTFWLTSRFIDPLHCQINSPSGLQYVCAVWRRHSALGPTRDPSQSELMSTQKLQRRH